MACHLYDPFTHSISNRPCTERTVANSLEEPVGGADGDVHDEMKRLIERRVVPPGRRPDIDRQRSRSRHIRNIQPLQTPLVHIPTIRLPPPGLLDLVVLVVDPSKQLRLSPLQTVGMEAL